MLRARRRGLGPYREVRKPNHRVVAAGFELALAYGSQCFTNIAVIRLDILVNELVEHRASSKCSDSGSARTRNDAPLPAKKAR